MAKISPQGKFRALDELGAPLSGGKLYTFVAGTSTPKATFKVSDESSSNSNPIILDAEGYADVWLASGSYKFVLDSSTDVNQFTTDDITGEGAGGYLSSVQSIAANKTITTADKNSLFICTASLTINLLAVATAGDGFVISVKNTSAGVVTIDPNISELIDGSATLTIGAGVAVDIICNGSAWVSYGETESILNNDNTFTGDNTFTKKVITPDAGELTIASGSITPTGVYHTVDTESDASSDDLDTISGGVDGQILTIRQEDDARDVTITNAGNIVLPSDVDIILNDTKDSVSFIYDVALTKWIVTSISQDLPDASTTVKGKVELATDAEVITGTDTARVPPVSAMRKHQGMCKAWVSFKTTSPTAIKDSFNVTSLTDLGTGRTTVNFDVDFTDVNYSMTQSACLAETAAGGNSRAAMTVSRAVGSCQMLTEDAGSNTLQDCAYVGLNFMGDQ